MDPVTLAAAVRASKKAGLGYGVSTVVYGDSWAGINRASTGTVGTSGYVSYNSSHGPVTWANFFLGQALNVKNWAGITGQTTAQILARWGTDVAPYQPQLIVLMTPGTNDAAGGVPVATTQANLSSIFDLAAGIGAVVLTINIPPKSSPSATTAQLLFHHTLNLWLIQQQYSRRGVIVVDTRSAISDGTSAGDWIAKAATTPLQYTADGVHPATLGGAVIGYLIAKALAPILPKASPLLVGSDSSTTVGSVAVNYAPNPGFVGTAGTVANGATGTVPTGWQVKSTDGAALAGTVVSSVVSAATVDPPNLATGYPGDLSVSPWLKVQTTSAVSKVQVYGQVSGGTPFTVGDTFMAMAEVIFDSDVASVVGLGFNAAQFDASFHNITATDLSMSTNETWPGTVLGRMRGVVRTPTIAMPAGYTTQFVQFQFLGLGTFYIRRPQLLRNPAF